MKKSFFVLIFFLIIGCNKKKSEQSPEEAKTFFTEPSGVLVKIKTVETTVFQQEILANGIIEAKQKAELRFKTSERIASIKVRNGQRVTKGQVLAVLDNTILENQINKSKIDLDKAKNKLQEEKINYGVSSNSNEILDPIILNNLKIKSGYFEAENALERSQILYRQTIIKAPFPGIVANVDIKSGSFITSADIFCTLVNTQKILVAFSILENELEFIEIGQEVIINPFTDFNATYKGRITEINPLVDENGLIQIKAKIDDASTTLFDGMNVKITIRKPIMDVVVIPKEALVRRSNKEVVFTLEDGLAKWNYVNVLDENSTSYALKEGVKIGDIVIVSGNINLAHDAKVKVIDNAIN